jgi:competence protein ComEC
MQDSITGSKFLCLSSIFFCFGILIASFISFNLKIFFISLIPIIFCFLIYPRKKNIIFGALILFLFLGSFVFYTSDKEPYQEEVSSFPVFRNKLSNMYFRYLPGNEASFMSAMILGDKSLMTWELKEKLNSSGLRHIAAISGLHISLFAYLLFKIISLLNLRIKKKYFILFYSILIYLFLIGFPISAIRASLMIGVIFIGKLFGRKSSRRNIFFIAAIMLIFNPSLLVFNAGFQLSFGAVIGIVYFSPILSSLLKRIIKDHFWRNFLAMNIGIQLMTIPILIINFGQFSLVSIFSNLIVLPLIPFVIGLGIISSFFGFIPLLGNFSFLLMGAILRFILSIVDVFSSFSFSVINSYWRWEIFIVYYLFLFIFLKLSKETKDDFLVSF